ncbi:MAG: repeat-containing protein [Bacteroidota bacterium]|nr:repeat-containing protein [Bacteroidota bacterium]
MTNTRIHRLEQIIVDNPNDTFGLFALAKEYEKEENFEKSVQLFEKLLVADENYIGAYYHLGKVYEQLEEIKKALNIYEMGISIAKKLNDMHALSELQNAKMNLLM